MKAFTALVALGSFVPAVLGHGYVKQMRIGGKIYTGSKPYGSYSKDTPIRHITTVNPVTSVNSNDLVCGPGAKASTANTVAPATPGSTLEFWWASGQGNWGHSVGPIMTYMAKCPESGCVSWDPKDATWYKISETGRKPGSTAWYQADIKAGGSYKTTIPNNMPNGDYMVRHELIALHFAEVTGGAQFYPSCSQIRITGGASTDTLRSANGASSTKFPGAYKASDPGIKLNAYTSKSYTFPGPKVATFSASGGSGGDDGAATTTTEKAANTKPTSSNTPKATSAKPTATGKNLDTKPTATSSLLASSPEGPVPTTTASVPGSGGGSGGSCGAGKRRRRRSRSNSSERVNLGSAFSLRRRDARRRASEDVDADADAESASELLHWRSRRAIAMGHQHEARSMYERALARRQQEIELELFD